jgi:hypothetical protein
VTNTDFVRKVVTTADLAPDVLEVQQRLLRIQPVASP